MVIWMESMKQKIFQLADELLKDIQSLVKISDVEEMNRDHRDVIFISTQGDHTWLKLDENGKRIQYDILNKYKKYYELISSILINNPDSDLKKFHDSDNTIMKIIQQNEATWNKDMVEAMKDIEKAFKIQLSLFNAIDEKNNDPILIPDTNAMIYNPNLDKWIFNEINQFMLIIPPIILNELDILKNNHRVEKVRDKAEKIIRTIKGYRNRGKLNDGITIVKGKSKLKTMAIEPDFTKSLRTLDENNNDDKLIASFIEISRNYINVPIAIVTRDINLQNKCEFYNIPYIEPPEIKS